MTIGFELLTSSHSESSSKFTYTFKRKHTNSSLTDGTQRWEACLKLLSCINPLLAVKQTYSPINKLLMPNEQGMDSIKFIVKCYLVCTN